MKRILHWAIPLMVAGAAPAAVVVEDNLSGIATQTGAGPYIYTVSDIDLTNNVNVLVVGTYLDTDNDLAGASFGGVPADGFIDTGNSGWGTPRGGAFYWMNPNTEAGQSLVITNSASNNDCAYSLLGLSGVDSSVAVVKTGSTSVNGTSANITTTENNMLVVSFYSINASEDAQPAAPLTKQAQVQVNGGGTLASATATIASAGTTSLGWTPGGTANAVAGLAFWAGTEVPVQLISKYPTDGGSLIYSNDFPLVIGGIVTDGSSDTVFTDMMLLLNGSNVLLQSEVVQSGTTPFVTTTVSHVETELADGTYTAELIYYTMETFPDCITNSWEFTVVVPGTSGASYMVSDGGDGDVASSANGFAVDVDSSFNAYWTNDIVAGVTYRLDSVSLYEAEGTVARYLSVYDSTFAGYDGDTSAEYIGHSDNAVNMATVANGTLVEWTFNDTDILVTADDDGAFSGSGLLYFIGDADQTRNNWSAEGFSFYCVDGYNDPSQYGAWVYSGGFVERQVPEVFIQMTPYPYLFHSSFPEEGSATTNSSASIGGIVLDSTAIFDTNSFSLYLDGNTNDLLVAGDVIKSGGTNTISHLTTGLEVGTHTAELVFAGTNAPSVYYTNSWTFKVAPIWPGQRVYVDATEENTTVWNGFDYEVFVPYSGTKDNLDPTWFLEAGGNDGTVFQSANQTNSPRLKTTIDLPQEGVYKIYAYTYGIVNYGANWRIGVDLQDNPDGELPFHYRTDYPDDEDIYVHYLDGSGTLPWSDGSWATYYSTNLLSNPFTDTVLLSENDRRLMEIYVGTVVGSSVTVYVDDDPNANVSWGGDNTWYDGIGYELVTDEALILKSTYPTSGAGTNTSVTVGAVVFDVDETLDEESVKLYVDGTDVIDAGDVIKTGLSNSINHVVSDLAVGTHSVELIYATDEAPSVFYTNDWSFSVLPSWSGTRVYVDATTNNTTAWRGAGYGEFVADGVVSNWTLRTVFGNGGQIFQAAYSTDAPRLKTTVTAPSNGIYKVYAYMWVSPEGWRMSASASDNLSGELPLYLASDYPANEDLYVHYQDLDGAVGYQSGSTATAYSTNLVSNPFTESVLIAEGNRQMVEIYLGTVNGDEISVYIDNDLDGGDINGRTWYDGIAYEATSEMDEEPITESPMISLGRSADGSLSITWPTSAGAIDAFSVLTNGSLIDGTWAILPLTPYVDGDNYTVTNLIGSESSLFFKLESN